jgi:hypothetical protein
MDKWILLFLSIWVIIFSFLLTGGAFLIINNLVVAAIVAFYALKMDGWKKWLTLIIAVIFVLNPFIPSISGVISEVNDTATPVTISSPHVDTRNLLVGVLMMLVIFFPEKEGSPIE